MTKILRMPDPQEMEMEEQINDMCKKLHIMPPPVLRLKLEVFQDGKPLSVYEDRARSWVRNYYNFMTMQTMGLAPGVLGTTFGGGYLTMKNTSGLTSFAEGTTTTVSARNPINSATDIHYRASAGIATRGIVIGTGTTAESFEHHALAALITNGTSAGQMSYGAMDAPTTTYGAGKFTQTIIRYINNNSGGSITVNEAGLYCTVYIGSPTASSVDTHMLARDLLSPGVAVPDTAQLKVTYTIESATYPA